MYALFPTWPMRNRGGRTTAAAGTSGRPRAPAVHSGPWRWPADRLQPQRRGHVSPVPRGESRTATG